MNKTITSIGIFILAVIMIYCTKEKNSDLNLGFEKIESKTKKPIGWFVDETPNYRYSVDSTVVHAGRYSLKIENIGNANYISMFKAGMRIYPEEGKEVIKVTGYVNTSDTSAKPGLYIFNYDSDGNPCYTYARNLKISSTSNWKEYVVETKIGTNTDEFGIGVYLKGEGTTWIDDLKLEIDGKQVFSNPAIDYTANKKEIGWLRNQCIKINTDKPGSNFQDLEPLKQYIGNSRIVGLGENTHGSSEIFGMKHRLIEFLITEMGFSILSVEANMPEAYNLNEFVLNGKGDPVTLVKGLNTFALNTEEFLKLILWMNNYNTKDMGKVQLTGFDMSTAFDGALQNINKYAENHDRSLKLKIDSIKSIIENFSSNMNHSSSSLEELSQELNRMSKNIGSYIAENKYSVIKISSERDFNWLLQNAVIMSQSSDPRNLVNGVFRNVCMAENIKWILDNNPGSKIILWAHNGHLTKKSGSAGYFISKKFGNDYFNIGFLSNSGNFTAVNSSQKLTSDNLFDNSFPGSLEYSFHKTSVPMFFFDFGKISEDEPNSMWLKREFYYRTIGSSAQENKQFLAERISRYFNSIIYIDSTHASHRLF